MKAGACGDVRGRGVQGPTWLSVVGLEARGVVKMVARVGSTCGQAGLSQGGAPTWLGLATAVSGGVSRA